MSQIWTIEKIERHGGVFKATLTGFNPVGKRHGEAVKDILAAYDRPDAQVVRIPGAIVIGLSVYGFCTLATSGEFQLPDVAKREFGLLTEPELEPVHVPVAKSAGRAELEWEYDRLTMSDRTDTLESLDIAGRNGWEVFAVLDKGRTFYMKRPVSPDE